MHRRVAGGLATVVFVTLVVGALFAVPGGEAQAQENQLVPAQIEDVDRTVFEIQVFESGDARWGVSIQEDISSVDTDRIEQFNQFAETFVSEETETFENFQLRAQRLTRSGTNVTGREMAATDFERDAYYDDATQKGIVEMSFRWEGFAEVRGDSVIVSDVFAGGFSILENQRLEIQRGDGLRFTSVDPEPDSLEVTGNLTGSEWLRWQGPVEFEGGGLNVTLAPPEAIQDGGAGTDSSTDDSDEQTQESNLMLPLLLTVVLFVAVGSGVIWYLSTQGGTETPSSTTPETESDGVVTEPPEEEAPVAEEELLSDEDRVMKLLEDNGGRMRQVSIVEETEWSKSKVSMLLSDMEDDGEISKLRVGRENIISLSGEEPDAAGSPFENEGE